MNNLYLICGKSGSGKTYAVEKLYDECGYDILCSYTTRNKRHKNDTDHIYADVSMYYHMKAENQIAAETLYDHHLYWATIDQVNQSDLYVIDVAGIKSLQQLQLDRPLVVIYLDCPEELRMKRMRLRGDTTKDINKRIEEDATAFDGVEDLADFIIDVENNDTVEVLKEIINKCEEVSDGGIE